MTTALFTFPSSRKIDKFSGLYTYRGVHICSATSLITAIGHPLGPGNLKGLIYYKLFPGIIYYQIGEQYLRKIFICKDRREKLIGQLNF